MKPLHLIGSWKTCAKKKTLTDDEFRVTAKVRGVSVDRAIVDLYDQHGIWLTRVDVRLPQADVLREDAAKP